FRVAVLSRRALLLVPVCAAALGTVLYAAGARHQRTLPDFDGDGKVDVAIWRPPLLTGGDGTFYARVAANNFATLASATLGTLGDVPMCGDFDGDGKTDLAVYTPVGSHAWSIRLSSQGFTSITTFQWGTDGDIPFTGDFDGDGKSDIGVFRPSEGKWYVLMSKTGFTSGAVASWGDAASVPVVGDFDGDGKADLATIEPSEVNGLSSWYILQGGTNYGTAFAITAFGGPTVTAVPADYDGDGKADAAYFDPATQIFTVRFSKDGSVGTKQFGILGDIPVPADYDGDGKADIAVFRPANNNIYVQTAKSLYGDGFIRSFGLVFRDGDVPILAR
ncbi:MAG: VCBS repeat-containing protein, partial [Acidobacteriia bacterium]|nr:VCBS repeat-containing protein [Terriglobia bacterium]